jgi:hypothetical protein
VIGISLTAVRKIVFAVLIGVCVLGLAWYGWLFYISRDAREFDNANVFVTFHGPPAQCEIRMGLYAARHALPCEDMPSYVRDNLKLAVGATFAISDLGNNGPEIAFLTSKLEAAGYRSVGTIRIAFITMPEPPAGNR